MIGRVTLQNTIFLNTNFVNLKNNSDLLMITNAFYSSLFYKSLNIYENSNRHLKELSRRKSYFKHSFDKFMNYYTYKMHTKKFLQTKTNNFFQLERNC